MRKHALLLLTILLCAAGAISLSAPKGPSLTGGPVGACFVAASKYDAALAGKEQIAFDPGAIQFEGLDVPYDAEQNTVYISQNCDTSRWEGTLTARDKNARIYILEDSDGNKQQSIKEGRVFKAAVVWDGTYMECSFVFSGLPVISLADRDEEKADKSERRGRILVFDPYIDVCSEYSCIFHIRGNTSVIFDKKSYKLVLCDGSGNPIKESLLGLRKDDDWILNSLSTDRTLAREKVCYDLWKRLNLMQEKPVPSSEIRYCEVVLNNKYVGVYGLMMPIDRKLMQMEPGDILYRIKIWYEEMDIDGRLTDYNGELEIPQKNGFNYAEIKYPNIEGSGCIWDPLQMYQDMVFETGDMSEMTENGIVLDLDNFIFHELFCEMTRACDNSWKNVYIAAYGDGKGGYVLRETIWDLNYTFGEGFVWDPDHGNTVFLPETTDTYKLRYDRNYGYSRLTHIIDGIRDDTAKKWIKWRSEGISPDYVKSLFEENSDLLDKSGAFNRNEEKWYGTGEEYSFGKISDWITGRFRFLDEMYGFTG